MNRNPAASWYGGGFFSIPAKQVITELLVSSVSRTWINKYSIINDEYITVTDQWNSLAFPPPPHLQGYHDFIDEMLPHESPVHYGLHPNAEIEFLTVTSDNLFHTLLELQSPDAVMGEGASQTLEEKVGLVLFFLTQVPKSSS